MAAWTAASWVASRAGARKQDGTRTNRLRRGVPAHDLNAVQIDFLPDLHVELPPQEAPSGNPGVLETNGGRLAFVDPRTGQPVDLREKEALTASIRGEFPIHNFNEILMEYFDAAMASSEGNVMSATEFTMDNFKRTEKMLCLIRPGRYS